MSTIGLNIRGRNTVSQVNSDNVVETDIRNQNNIKLDSKSREDVQMNVQDNNQIGLSTSSNSRLGLSIGRSTGSGTKDYNQLYNKPSINDVVLIHNRTSAELNLQELMDAISTNEISALFN